MKPRGSPARAARARRRTGQAAEARSGGVTNARISAAFDEIADLLEIDGANPFRVRAYRQAARAIEGHPRSLADLVAEGGDPREVPGVGADLAGKIEALVRTGRIGFLEDLRRRVGSALTDLLRLPALGPKRVRALRDALGVRDLAGLRAALERGEVGRLRGFGPKTEARVRAGLETLASTPRRLRLDLAEPVVEDMLARLRAAPGVRAAEAAGSFRRRRETVGDLDLLVASSLPEAALDAFAAHPDVAEVSSKGGTRATVALRSGLQVDLRVVAPESYGAALHYFTGSKAHNIAIRRRGQARGLKINEYGVFRGERRVGGATEEEVFGAVGLPWIPPELREDRGEVEAAQEGRLPRLVELADLRGDLQSHTTDSDGRAGLEEMADAARRAGLRYLAITDHVSTHAVARGLDARRLEAQGRRIDALNDARGRGGPTLLKGAEVDIRKDGALALPSAALEGLDVVVCAVHSHFDLPREEQTRRILRAMEGPRAHVLGHPTGRLLGARAGADLDMERVLDAAADQGWHVEIDGQPDRLDLHDVHARMAKERGVKVAISSDAHAPVHFAHLRRGVDQARRGWLEPGDVLNARPLGQLRRLLRR